MIMINLGSVFHFHSQTNKIYINASPALLHYTHAMSKRLTLPCALTIAGSDSGGGAGIQADLKTFAAFGVHGASALTCVTAQNSSRVSAIQPCRPEIVREQIEAVLEGYVPRAVKTGMLYSAAIILAVSESLELAPHLPLILDPVMVASSGRRLLQPSALKALREKLLPRATLITPNLDEAALLTKRALRTVEASRAAAREIHEQFGCAVLVKGGHLPNAREAADIFYDGKTELLLTAPFIKGLRTHGTGCTYSAAITAGLALGLSLPAAVERGKNFITQAIAQSYLVNGHSILHQCRPS
jgi:hydroxymethylpyrimidine/phosphomethylpyrimidine kinase